MWILNTHCDGIWKWGFRGWLGHGDRVLRNGISTPIKETPQNSLAPSATWEHKKKTAVKEQGSKSFPDTESADALILDSLAFRTLRNKCFLFISHPFYCSDQKGLSKAASDSPLNGAETRRVRGQSWLVLPIRPWRIQLCLGFVKQLQLFFKPFGFSKTKNSFCQALSPIIFKPMCILREI